MTQNTEPSTTRKRLTEFALAFAVVVPTAIGLGYAWEEGNKKEAQRWHERLTDSQKSIIQAAADADECGVINSRVSRLCMYVKNGEMKLYPENASRATPSLGPKPSV